MNQSDWCERFIIKHLIQFPLFLHIYKIAWINYSQISGVCGYVQNTDGGVHKWHPQAVWYQLRYCECRLVVYLHVRDPSWLRHWGKQMLLLLFTRNVWRYCLYTSYHLSLLPGMQTQKGAIRSIIWSVLWQGQSESFLNFSEKYDVHKMKDAIEPALKRLLNPQNSFRFLELAYQFELIELEALAAPVVQSNFLSAEMSANMKVSKDLTTY